MSEYSAYRHRLLSSLRGRVLEIGAGTGRTLRLLPAHGVTWQGLELDPRRFAQLQRVSRGHRQASDPLRATAECMPLPDACIDSVVSLGALCSVTDAHAAVAEARRVLRPGGELIFTEHVAPPVGTWSRWALRVLGPVSRRLDHRCDPLRDTEVVLQRSQLEMREIRRFELPQPLGVRVPYVAGIARR